MRPAPRRLLLVIVPALILLLPASVAAFPLSNCTLTVTSRDATGAVIGTATNGANDATQSDPLEVEWDGSVDWVGTTGSQTIMNHNWHVDVFMLPTPLRGGDPNTSGNPNGDGTVDVSANLPFQIVGAFYVSGEIAGDGGSCSGSGWMKLRGNPIGTLPFWAGVILFVLGGAMLWGAFRGSWWMAIVGGFLFGLGAAVLLIVLAVLLLGGWTPIAAIVLGIVIGIVLRVLGGRAASPAMA
jgi:hypothetical protein